MIKEWPISDLPPIGQRFIMVPVLPGAKEDEKTRKKING